MRYPRLNRAFSRRGGVNLQTSSPPRLNSNYIPLKQQALIFNRYVKNPTSFEDVYRTALLKAFDVDSPQTLLEAYYRVDPTGPNDYASRNWTKIERTYESLRNDAQLILLKNELAQRKKDKMLYPPRLPVRQSTQQRKQRDLPKLLTDRKENNFIVSKNEKKKKKIDSPETRPYAPFRPQVPTPPEDEDGKKSATRNYIESRNDNSYVHTCRKV